MCNECEDRERELVRQLTQLSIDDPKGFSRQYRGRMADLYFRYDKRTLSFMQYESW